jgi:hypothetical protein
MSFKDKEVGMDSDNRQGLSGVSGHQDVGRASLPDNSSERYIIGSGLYYMASFNSFGAFHNFIQPATYYCWCLFKEVRHPDQSLTVEVSEVIQSVLIYSNGENEWVDLTMANETTAERLEVYCLTAEHYTLRYPDHVAFLYGLADHHTEVRIRWDMAREFLDVLNAHIAASPFFSSPIFVGVNHYIYGLLGGLLGISPVMLEDYPLSDSMMLPPMVRREPIQMQMHSALSEGQSARLGHHAFFEYELPTPPPSPANSDREDEAISLTM